MIILPLELTTAEIRVLQEFRRLTTETLPLETIKALKHPTGALGEAPAASLVGKGFLTGEGETFAAHPESQRLPGDRRQTDYSRKPAIRRPRPPWRPRPTTFDAQVSVQVAIR